MAAYKYVCEFGHAFEVVAPMRDGPPSDVKCEWDTARVHRDYRSEGVRSNLAQVNLTRAEAASLFLPSTDDFKGPSDPDGTIGMRQWNDENEPRSSNTRPYRPGGKSGRRSF